MLPMPHHPQHTGAVSAVPRPTSVSGQAQVLTGDNLRMGVPVTGHALGRRLLSIGSI
jgi:hypothetical protein